LKIHCALNAGKECNGWGSLPQKGKVGNNGLDATFVGKLLNRERKHTTHKIDVILHAKIDGMTSFYKFTVYLFIYLFIIYYIIIISRNMYFDVKVQENKLFRPFFTIALVW